MIVSKLFHFSYERKTNSGIYLESSAFDRTLLRKEIYIYRKCHRVKSFMKADS